MKDTNLEKLGMLIDRLDNIIQMGSIPLPAEMHLEGIKPALPEIRTEILSVYKDEGGTEF